MEVKLLLEMPTSPIRVSEFKYHFNPEFQLSVNEHPGWQQALDQQELGSLPHTQETWVEFLAPDFNQA